MADFRKRFTRKEFIKELTDHLSSVPTDTANRGLLEKNIQHKANKYEEALRHLDEVSKTLEEIAQKSDDASLKKKAKAGIQHVNDAINTYGESSLDFNNDWFHYKD